jgi:hypothetical protein
MKRYILGVQRSSGRLGDVFQAIEAVGGREVTALALRPDVRDVSGLRSGYSLLAALRHGNIARLLEVSELSGRTLVIYERLAGETLAERAAIARHRPIRSAALANFLYQAAQALAYAEKFRVGHGAISGGALHLLSDGRVLVSQLGLRGLLERTAEDRPDYTQQDMHALAEVIDSLWANAGDNEDLERTIFRMQLGDPGNGYRNFAALVSDLEYMRANVRTTALPERSRTSRLAEAPAATQPAAPARATALAALFLPESGQVIEITRYGEHTIGRKHLGQAIVPDIDLTIHQSYQGGVSKLHARLVVQPDRAEVFDMYSANGTHVNGFRLMPETAMAVQHGDMLTFGRLKTQFLRYGEGALDGGGLPGPS